MDPSSSVFGRLRGRGHLQPKEDEWYIPYKPMSSTQQHQGGIGFSPPTQRTSQSHNILSFLSTSSTAPPDDYSAVPTTRYSRSSAHAPVAFPSHYSTLSRTQHPARPAPGPLAKSASFNSLNNVVPLAARIPSSTSVPTGLREPKLLFSPLNREIRATLVQPLPEDVSERVAPRSRTVSGPEAPRRGYPASQAPPTRWAAPTLCDMIVFPRPSILPHDITPPGSPEGAGRTAWESAVQEEARRTQEREAWANYVRQRGRSSSFGAARAPRDGPIIGSYRVRSREHSQDRPRADGGEGRKRSNSLSAKFARRRSKSDAAGTQAAKAIKAISCAPARTTEDPNSSHLPFLTMTGDRDRDDPFHAALPDSNPGPNRTARHAHTASSPDLRAGTNTTSRIRSQPLKSLRIVPPVRENRGDVVVIGPKPVPKRRSSLPRTELDFGKPLPSLPTRPTRQMRSSQRTSTPRIPLDDFEPLSSEIDRAMSLRSATSSQFEPPSATTSFVPPVKSARSRTRTVAEPAAEAALRTSVASTSQDSATGQAHARSVLAKQHQRSLNRRAFAAPVPAPRRGRDSTPSQSNLRASVRSANSVYSQPDYPSASSKDQLIALTSTPPYAPLASSPIARETQPVADSAEGTPGPLRKKTAMEEAVHRSRAGSVGNMDAMTPPATAKSGLRPRPHTADSEERGGEVTPRPPPSFSDSPTTVRKAPPPPLQLSSMNRAATPSKLSRVSGPPSSALLSAPLSPPLDHPISVVPSPTIPYGFEPRPNYLAPPRRPELLHADTKSSGMTVYTDASEGWDREMPPPEAQQAETGRKNESPDDMPSPKPNPDQDFQDLFFRTPYDPGASPPHSSSSSRDLIPPLPSEGVIGLGYELETSSSIPSMPNSTSWPTVSSSRSSRPISSGTLSGDSELATPQLVDLKAERRPQITYVDAGAGIHPPPSNSSNATLVSKHLADRRESAGSGHGSRDVHAGSQESPTAPSHSHEDFLLGRGIRGQMTSAIPPPDLQTGTRRVSAVEYTPTTFGIPLPADASSPPFPAPDFSPPVPPHNAAATFEPLHDTPRKKQNRKSASFLPPASPSASYSPAAAASLASPASPGRSEKHHSAAVSFMSDFPTPPEVHTPHFGEGEVLRMRGGSALRQMEEHESAFGQVLTGPPGAGKTTYCYGMHQLLTALQRPVHIVNLDPAVPNPPYPCSINITELITLEEVMEEHGLGPNGAMLYCAEHLEENFDWLVERLDEVLRESPETAEDDEGEGGAQEAYVIFDTPGQVELWTNHESLRRVIERLGKLDYRLAAVHLSDAHYITDASKFISATLLAMRAMLALELPHVNVLSKIDLLAQYGPLPFDLKYYTQAEDLGYLLSNLDDGRGGEKMKRLNQALVELIDQYGLVHWETCAVEDKQSMLHLLRVLDKATGYVFLPAANADSITAMPQNVAGEMPGWDVDDVQERWIDNKEQWDEVEKQQWAAEGEARRALAEAGKQTQTES